MQIFAEMTGVLYISGSIIIELKTSQIFGEKSEFAIQYRACPEPQNHAPGNKLAICHLIIAGNFIGYRDEVCYLPTWLSSLTRQRNCIAKQKNLPFPEEFTGLSDREIFETVFKANQLPEEFRPDFLYLPQLDNKFWIDHCFTLDETIDRYLICFYIRHDQITFLIDDDKAGLGGDHGTNSFTSHSVDFDLFVDTVDQATAFLIKEYPLG